MGNSNAAGHLSHFANLTNGQLALQLAARDFAVTPNWRPDKNGQCAYRGHLKDGKVTHEEKDTGKAAYLSGWQNRRLTEAEIREAWRRTPLSNVGVVLALSDVLVIDPDTDEALAEVYAKGVNGAVIRQSRMPAFLFRAPADCPKYRATHKGDSGHIDVLTAGQVIVHGQHREGHPIYLDVLDLGEIELATAPDWAVEIIRQSAPAGSDAAMSEAPDDDPPVRLNEQAMKVWRGQIVVDKADGQIRERTEQTDVDRSDTLFLIGQDLAQAGATRRTIIDALADRDAALGYEKYNARRDQGAAEYARIADAVLAPRPTTNGRVRLPGNGAASGGADRTPGGATAVDAVAHVPDLPLSARLSPEMIVAAERARCHWLAPYIELGRILSPRTSRALHEDCAIFALCTAIARRAYVDAGPKSLYPALFVLFVGRSTLCGKTTALLDVLRKILADAGLLDLLLPASFTPQALMADLALHVPAAVRDGASEAQARWLEKHRHGAQRAILRDEVAGLLDDCAKDYNTGLLPLLLKLDGAPDYVESEITIARGLVEAQDVCVNLIGATTPAALREHASKPYHWANGLFGRFRLSAPDEPPHWDFWARGDTQRQRGDVVQRLRRIYNALPATDAEFTYGAAKDEGPQPIVGARQVGYDARRATIAEEAWQAWSRYDRALFDLAAAETESERLDPTYGRLANAAIRVALALAVAEWALSSEGRDAPIRVTIAHWAAAQQIAERWRHAAHRVLAAALLSEDAEGRTKQADRLVKELTEHGGRMRRGDLLRVLNWKSEQLDAAIAASCGRVAQRQEKSGGRPSEWVELVVSPDGPGGGQANGPFSAFSAFSPLETV